MILSHDALVQIDEELQNYPDISPIFYANEQILTNKKWFKDGV